nr:olfactory receptor 67 [Gregopimpla kuwanae]
MDRFVWKFLIPVPTIFVLGWLIPLTSHVIIRDLSGIEILACLGPMTYQVTNLAKNYTLIFHTKAIKICIQHMEIDWQKLETQNDREIMKRNLKIGHDLSLICVGCMYGGALFFNALPLLAGSYVNEFNETIRPLAFPGTDIFIDLQKGYNYELVVCFNWGSAFFLHIIVTAICDLASTLVGHACGQVQVVIARLENLVNPEEDCESDVVESRIAFIVETHVRTLRFAAKIDSILQEICLMEALCSTLMICWLEYFCVTNLENSDAFALFAYFLLLLSFCFNIFVFCHIGELLKEQCEEVGKAAYMMEWYRLPGKTGLALMMLIAVSKYPPKLTAGQMMELSYNSFGSIMQTSFAYLNMLRQMGES